MGRRTEVWAGHETVVSRTLSDGEVLSYTTGGLRKIFS